MEASGETRGCLKLFWGGRSWELSLLDLGACQLLLDTPRWFALWVVAIVTWPLTCWK